MLADSKTKMTSSVVQLTSLCKHSHRKCHRTKQLTVPQTNPLPSSRRRNLSVNGETTHGSLWLSMSLSSSHSLLSVPLETTGRDLTRLSTTLILTDQV